MSQQHSASPLRNGAILFILILLFQISGCGKSSYQNAIDSQKKLIGTWQEQYVSALNPTATIFLEDGSFQHMTRGDIDGTGKWQVLQDGRLKLTEIAGAPKPTLFFKMAFTSEKELTLTEEGDTESLQKLIKIK